MKIKIDSEGPRHIHECEECKPMKPQTEVKEAEKCHICGHWSYDLEKHLSQIHNYEAEGK